MSVCKNCKKELSSDEISLYLKMVNRAAQDFICKECLAAELRVTTELLDERIEYFRSSGCALFSQKNE